MWASKQLLHDHSTPLSSRIGSLLDVRLGHVSRRGPKILPSARCQHNSRQILQDNIIEAQEVLNACDSMIEHHLGLHPTYTMTNRIDHTTISMQTYVVTDVCRALISKTRRPTFDVRYDAPREGLDPNSLGLLICLGIPPDLLCLLAEITSISIEGRVGDSPHSSRRSPRVARVLDDLKTWTPTIGAGLTTSSQITEVVSTQLMWREVSDIPPAWGLHKVTRMLAFQFCLGKGVLARCVQDTLSEFLRAADTLLSDDSPGDNGLRIFVQAAKACAWFVASTCAISTEDRAMCRMGLGSCGSGRMYRDNAVVIQRLWERMDDTGELVDWRDFVARQDITVAFL